MPFQVVAIQLHSGAHYRSLLNGQNAFGLDRQWLTDDNMLPQHAQREHDEAAYLIWLRQADFDQ